MYYSDDEDEDEEAEAERKQRAMKESGMTRRERRKAAVRCLYLILAFAKSFLESKRIIRGKLMQQKLSVAELKQLVERPEVVEWFDTDARDPRLLVTVKSYRK